MSVCFKSTFRCFGKTGLVYLGLSSRYLSLFALSFALSAQATPTLEFVPNQLIVQYRPAINGEQISEAAQAQNMRSSRKLTLLAQRQRKDGKGELAVIQLATSMKSSKELVDTIAQLQQDPAVEYAEPNWIYHKLDTGVSYRHGLGKPDQHHWVNFPNDSYYRNGESWGMYGDKTLPANPYGSQAGEAWIEKHKPIDCSDVYIGVIDEGIMKQHPDLKDSVWVNRFDPVDGIDNDGNGYVDDSNGWDFNHDDHSIYDKFEDFHGTHVAGILSAAGNNGIGIAGVCWKAKLIAAKFLGPDGGDTVNAIRAIDYITDLKARHGLNVVATNNSWGGGGYSRALVDAIKRAEAQNILFVAAAGNDGIDNDEVPLYPASYANNNIISVAALMQDGLIWGGSNFGYRSVDIAAPGDGIISTVPDFDGKPGYAYDGGTSMAAPFVTGAIARYAVRYPHGQSITLKQAVLGGAKQTDSLFGLTATGGRLDISRMLELVRKPRKKSAPTKQLTTPHP